MSETATLTARDLLRNRDFTKLWLGQTISTFGDSLTNLTLVILVNTVSGSTAAIAALTMLIALPQIVFGLLAGVYVDRWDRRRIMLVSDAVRALLVLGLIAVHDAGQLWLVYVLAFAQAAVGTFFAPARMAFTRTLLPPQGLMAANSLMQTSAVLAGVAGAALSGVLVGVTGTYGLAFGIDSVTFILSFLLIAWIRLPAAQTSGTPVPEVPPGVRQIWRELVDGLRVIVQTRVLAGVLVVSAVIMLGVGAVNVLFVPFLSNVLQVPTLWFGAVEASQVLGMIIGGTMAAVIMTRFKPTRVIALGAIGLGAMVGALSLASNVGHVVLILFIVGLLVAPLQAAASTLMQTSVPLTLLGRAASSLNTLVTTSSLISMAFAGAFGDVIGIRNVFLIGGALAILGGLAGARLFAGAAPMTQSESMQPATGQAASTELSS